MAASLVAGAAFEIAFGKLLRAVLLIKEKAVMFKRTLVYTKSTLIAIAPLVKEIEKQNDDLGRPKEELESLVREMEEGTKLISECCKIHRLNYVARIRYEDQLEALVDSLVRFFLLDMQVQSARDQKETLIKVTKILGKVNKLSLIPSNTGEIALMQEATDSCKEDIIDEAGRYFCSRSFETSYQR